MFDKVLIFIFAIFCLFLMCSDKLFAAQDEQEQSNIAATREYLSSRNLTGTAQNVNNNKECEQAIITVQSSKQHYDNNRTSYNTNARNPYQQNFSSTPDIFSGSMIEVYTMSALTYPENKKKPAPDKNNSCQAKSTVPAGFPDVFSIFIY